MKQYNQELRISLIKKNYCPLSQISKNYSVYSIITLLLMYRGVKSCGKLFADTPPIKNLKYLLTIKYISSIDTTKKGICFNGCRDKIINLPFANL